MIRSLKKWFLAVALGAAALAAFGLSAAAAGADASAPGSAAPAGEAAPAAREPVLVAGAKSTLDVADAADGTFRVRWNNASPLKLKVIVEKGGDKYTYDLAADGSWVAYPLQMGDGSYLIKVCENLSGNRYAVVQTYTLAVTLTSEFAPYLAPNQMIDYTGDTSVVQTAADLAEKSEDEFAFIDACYAYAAGALTYDTAKARTVESGYLPDIDAIVELKKGICFDYASIFAAMLRSQGIPTRMVMGYVAPRGTYHAWNEAYVEGVGWIKTGDITFDGDSWKRMDPTFTSSSRDSKRIRQFIADNGNYQDKYYY